MSANMPPTMQDLRSIPSAVGKRLRERYSKARSISDNRLDVGDEFRRVEDEDRAEKYRSKRADSHASAEDNEAAADHDADRGQGNNERPGEHRQQRCAEIRAGILSECRQRGQQEKEHGKQRLAMFCHGKWGPPDQ